MTMFLDSVWQLRSAVAWGIGWSAATLALSAPAAAPLPVGGDPLAEVQALARDGHADAALRRADTWMAAHPDDPRLPFEKGLLLARLQRTREAIAVFERMSQRFPELVEPLNNLAVLYAGQGELDRARQALEASMQRQESVRIAQANLADVNMRLAGRAYAHALQIDVGPAAAQLTLIGHLPGAGAGPGPVPAGERVAALGAMASPAVAAGPATSAAPAARQPPSAVAAAASRPSYGIAVAVPAPVASSAATVPSAAAAAAVAIAAQAAPAPASASAAKTALRPATEPAEAVAVRGAVAAWATAWSQKNLAAYFAAYVPGYMGSDANAAAWQAARRVRILGKSRIRVTLSQVAVEPTRDGAKASFRQSYAADQLSVTSTKTLDLVKQDGKWLIRKEVAGS